LELDSGVFTIQLHCSRMFAAFLHFLSFQNLPYSSFYFDLSYFHTLLRLAGASKLLERSKPLKRRSLISCDNYNSADINTLVEVIGY
jgi:hypothetical protein